MSDHTHIEWTDATWNPVTGCSIVSPGCRDCYAMGLAGTRLKHHPSRAGLTREVNGRHVWTGEVRLNESWLAQPLGWKRPRMIFVCAHGDLFHEDVPDAWIDRVFAVMALSPQHTFQVLTKRAARMRAYCDGMWARREALGILMEKIGGDDREGWFAPESDGKRGWSGMLLPLPNVWLGVSAERQAEADARIPDLLATPAAVRFVSLEPLLGWIDLAQIDVPNYGYLNALDDGYFTDGRPPRRRLDWVIVGGESGDHARPMHPTWARGLRDQCVAAHVPFFFKQWGAWLPVDQHLPGHGRISGATAIRPGGPWRLHYAGSDGDPAHAFAERGVGGATIDDHMTFNVGKKAAGRLLDGVVWDQMPASSALHEVAA